VKREIEVSERLKNIEVERKAFEDVLRKLLNSPPTSKAEVSKNIRVLGRKRSLTRRLLP